MVGLAVVVDFFAVAADWVASWAATTSRRCTGWGGWRTPPPGEVV